MSQTPDIKVKVGVAGGADINGESGKIILKELHALATKIKPKVIFGVDKSNTSSLFEKELRSIAKGIKAIPINISFNNIEKEVSNSVSAGLKNGFSGASIAASTNGTASKQTEIQALVDVLEKLDTVQKSINRTENYASKPVDTASIADMIKQLEQLTTMMTLTERMFGVGGFPDFGGMTKGWLKIVSDNRTRALYNPVVTLNEPILFGKRLYNKSLKWCA